MHPSAQPTSAACVIRHPGNPVLSARDVPYPSSLVFNAGICRWGGRYLMIFRNDVGPRAQAEAQHIDPDRTTLGVAWSDDGIAWQVREQPLALPPPEAFGIEASDFRRLYDPRLHVLDGTLVMCCALDTHHGVLGAILRTDDLVHWEVLHTTLPDNRNLVLFPERIGGRYHRLDRPFPVYSRGRDRFDLWASSSPDLRDWGGHRLVLGVEHVPYANDKIGPAAPPIRTPAGWLCIFHAVDRDETRGANGWEPRWTKRYHAGIALLDLERPWVVLGMAKQPLLTPEASYEIAGGFRNHVIFPTGAVLGEDGMVRIWYGAADTVMALATARCLDLIALCRSPR